MFSKKQPFLPDEKILTLYQDREEAAIRETDRKYRAYLYTVAFQILKNPEESEECLSDTYLRTWNAIPPAKPQNLLAFLAKITRRLALDHYDKKHSKKRIPSEICDPLADMEAFLYDPVTVEETWELQEIRRILHAYLENTTKRKLYIFVKRYYFMTPIAAIAKALSCSESTVNKEIAAIKKQLKEKLEKEGYTV